jgi:hypothetical protein
MEILSVWLDMKAVSLIESLLIVETPLPSMGRRGAWGQTGRAQT